MKLEKQSEVSWVTSVHHTVYVSAQQFLPHNSAPAHCMGTLSMHMDREFEEEQIGVLFVLSWAVFRGVRGVVILGLPLQKVFHCFFYPAPPTY